MNLAQHPLIAPVGWTLLHFVWQGLAIAGLLALALTVLRRRSANVRYVAGCVALGLMAVSPVVTFILVRSNDSTPLTPQQVEALAVYAKSVTVFSEPSSPWSALLKALEPFLPSMVMAWTLGMILLSLRMAGGLFQVERLKRRGSKPAGEPWQGQLDAIAGRLGIRRSVMLLESPKIDVPSAMGVLKATILVPCSALTRLSPQDLEALLAHELAHIARHDYLVNLLQTLVETTLFYHPAVWWTSHVIRVEREHCCDDMAIGALGDAVQYARALTTLEEQRAPRPILSLGANGGSLMQRIRRILGLAPSPNKLALTWVPCLAVLALVLPLGTFTQAQQGAQKKSEGPDISIDVKDAPSAKRSFRKEFDRALSDPNGVIYLDGKRYKVSDLTPEQKAKVRKNLDEAAEQMTRAISEANIVTKKALKDVFAEDGPVNMAIKTAMEQVRNLDLSNIEHMDMHDSAEAKRAHEQAMIEAKEAREESLSEAKRAQEEAMSEAKAASEEAMKSVREAMRDQRESRQDARKSIEEARRELKRAAEELRRAKDEARRHGEKDPTQIDVHVDVAKILEDVSKSLENLNLDEISGKAFENLPKAFMFHNDHEFPFNGKPLDALPKAPSFWKDGDPAHHFEFHFESKDLPDPKVFKFFGDGKAPFMFNNSNGMPGMTKQQRAEFEKQMKKMREELRKQFGKDQMNWEKEMKKMHDELRQQLKDVPSVPATPEGANIPEVPVAPVVAGPYGGSLIEKMAARLAPPVEVAPEAAPASSVDKKVAWTLFSYLHYPVMRWTPL